MATTVRFTPRRLLLIAILIPLMLVVALLLRNRVAYTGIMVPTSTTAEGIAIGDNILYITTNRLTQATYFSLFINNTSPRTLATITIHARLLNDDGTVVGSSTGQAINIKPGDGQWIRENFDQSVGYTRADYDIKAMEWR